MNRETASKTCPFCEDFVATRTPEDGETAEERAANAVIAHAVSKVDEDHAGIGYEKALRMIDLDDAGELEPAGRSMGPDVPDVDEQRATDGGIRELPVPDVDEEECPTCGSTSAVVPVEELIDELPDELLERVQIDLASQTWCCENCTQADETGLVAEVW